MCTRLLHPRALLTCGSQVLAFSATYTETLLSQLRQLMSFPQEVMLCPQTVTLRGASWRTHALRLSGGLTLRVRIAGVKQLYAEVSSGACVPARGRARVD